MYQIFLAFSIITNGKKIINTTRQPGQIEFFSGLRVLSMFWIIMGHRCAGTDGYAINIEDIENVINLPKIGHFNKFLCFSGKNNGIHFM